MFGCTWKQIAHPCRSCSSIDPEFWSPLIRVLSEYVQIDNWVVQVFGDHAVRVISLPCPFLHATARDSIGQLNGLNAGKGKLRTNKNADHH